MHVWLSSLCIFSPCWMLFHIQATDVPEYDLRTDEKQTAVNKESDVDDGIPEDFDCYKMLMDAKLNPDAVEPIGEDCGLQFHLQLFIFVRFPQAPKSLAIQWPHSKGE